LGANRAALSAQLFDAIAVHDTDRVRQLLLEGADPNGVQAQPPQHTPLRAAVEELCDGGSTQMVALLLEQGADANGWDGQHQMTPLLAAVFDRENQAVQLLLQAGADPNVHSDEGQSALLSSVEANDLEMTAALLRHGATRSMNEWSGLQCLTPLGQAARDLNVPMIKLLLDAGADPGAIDEDGRTAIDRLPAVDSGNARDRIAAETLLHNNRRQR